MLESLLSPELTALAMIIMIDIVMSGDNAILIGLAAAGLPPEHRRKAIVYGIIGATVLRIIFAAMVVQLLSIIGIKLAGGLLLLWVCWRMWQELRAGGGTSEEAIHEQEEAAQKGPPKTLRAAMINIIVADVSMSLDNVLAVAGAARDHLGMLVFGLVLSIALMGVTANYIAKLLERHTWIAYLGLAIIAFVAVDMIWRGGNELQGYVISSLTLT